MLSVPHTVRIFLYDDAVDLRKGFDREGVLQGTLQETLAFRGIV